MAPWVGTELNERIANNGCMLTMVAQRSNEHVAWGPSLTSASVWRVAVGLVCANAPAASCAMNTAAATLVLTSNRGSIQRNARAAPARFVDISRRTLLIHASYASRGCAR